MSIAPRLVCVVVAVLASGAAVAAPITPTFTTFGALPAATFSGSGIPNNAVAISTTADLTIGLTAHQRFVGPNLVHDGAGTFTAFPGVSTGGPTPTPTYASWNFAYYISGTAATDLSYVLEYDFDPAAGTDASAHGRLVSFAFNGMTSQNSANLGFGFLATGFPNLAIAPGGTFDPNALGEYSFRLTASTAAGVQVAQTAIRVNVGQNVPEPATLALVGLALAGLGLSRRSKA